MAELTRREFLLVGTAAGIQTPIVRDGDQLVGTERLHSDMKWKNQLRQGQFRVPRLGTTLPSATL